MSKIHLRIEAVSGARKWQIRCRLNDHERPTPDVTPETVVQLRNNWEWITKQCQPDQANGYCSRRPMVTVQFLNDLVQCLRKMLEPIQSELEEVQELVISSEIPEALNLAWELLPVKAGQDSRPLGCDPNRLVYRIPHAGLLTAEPPGSDQPRQGPLRVLLFVAAPVDQPELAYEREVEALERIAFDSNSRLSVLRTAGMGTLEELKEQAERFRPHIVHLSGHAAVVEGVGCFCFEDEGRGSDFVSASELVRTHLKDYGVRLILFNGCQTSQAAEAGLCQAMVRAGLPLALGWAAHVADDRAIQFIQTFYQCLAAGRSLPWALGEARKNLWNYRQQTRNFTSDRTEEEVTYFLPRLYAANCVTDWNFDREESGPAPCLPPRTPPTGFVGRRQELRQILPQLLSGEVRLALLTGLKGQGKTALAGELGRCLAHEGYQTRTIWAGRIPGQTPADSETDFLEQLQCVLEPPTPGRKSDPKPPRQTLEHLLNRLAGVLSKLKRKLLLVLDNLSSLATPFLNSFLPKLVSGLAHPGQARVVITSRSTPQIWTELEDVRQVHHELPEFAEDDFWKFLDRDKIVAQQLREGVLDRDRLREIYQQFGGNPGFLRELRMRLRQVDHRDPDRRQELYRQVKRGQAAFLKINGFDQAYAGLPNAERRLLRRLAFSNQPLTASHLCQLTELSQERCDDSIKQILAAGCFLQTFADPGQEDRYLVHGLLRDWFCDPGRRPWLSRLYRPAASNGSPGAGFDAFVNLPRIAPRDQWPGARQPAMARLRAAVRSVGDGCFRAVTWLRDFLPDEGRTTHSKLALIGQAAHQAHLRNSTQNIARQSPWLAHCQRHARQAGDWERFRWATIPLAGQACRQRDFERAKQELESVPWAQRNAAWAILSVPVECALSGLPAAWKYYEKARFNAGAGTPFQAASLQGLAEVAKRRGDRQEAGKLYIEARGCWSTLGDEVGMVACQQGIAEVNLNAGEFGQARSDFQTALELWRQLGDHARQADCLQDEVLARQADCLQGLALVMSKDKHFDQAREHLKTALDLRRGLNDSAATALYFQGRGEIYQAAGHDTEAKGYFESAEGLWLELRDRAGEAACWQALGELHLKVNALNQAREAFEKAQCGWNATGNLAGEAVCFRQLGWVACGQKQCAAGVRLAAIGYMLFEKIDTQAKEQVQVLITKWCKLLNYTAEQQSAMRLQAEESYRKQLDAQALWEEFAKTS